MIFFFLFSLCILLLFLNAIDFVGGFLPFGFS